MTRPLTLSPSDEMRLFLGCLAQPFLAAALTFLTFPLIDYSHGGSTVEPLETAVGIALAVAIAAAVIAVCALPVAVWVVKRTTVSLEHAVLFGAGFGNMPAVVGLLAGPLSVRAVALGTFLGISGGALFWVIAIRGRVFGQRQVAD